MKATDKQRQFIIEVMGFQPQSIDHFLTKENAAKIIDGYLQKRLRRRWNEDFARQLLK